MRVSHHPAPGVTIGVAAQDHAEPKTKQAVESARLDAWVSKLTALADKNIVLEANRVEIGMRELAAEIETVREIAPEVDKYSEMINSLQ